MKKYLLLIITAVFTFVQTGFAQDDDIYFVPSKSNKQKAKVEKSESSYDLIESDDFSYDNWAEYRTNGSRDVDEYNRRKPSQKQDKVSQEEYDIDESANGTYTERIVRFHSPRVGIYVSSPFYVDYFDLWYDPWFYDPWFGYTYVGWHGWGPSPFYWHYSWYWNSWYDPWGPCYGWYNPHYYPGYYPHYRPIPNGATRGPHGGYVYYGNRNNSYSGGYSGHNRYGGSTGNRPSREYGYGTSRRPSRDYGNNTSRRPSSDYNNTNSRPSRRFGNSSGNSPSRSYNSSPSRSYNTSPSRSFDRSFNSGHSGGGRSIGGGHSGGGRSFGGRR